MTERLRCIVCGGEHQPTSAMVCDEDGMDREIARMGNRQWTRITGQVMRQVNRAAVGENAARKEGEMITKTEALEWLQQRPTVKKMIDGLDEDGVLEKLINMAHADAGSFIDLIGIAEAAGYKTGRDEPPRS